MKEIGAVIGKISGLVFAAAVIGYTAYLTYMLAQRLVPGNTILQAMTIVLFDIGALVWFVLFLTQAMGTAQWAIAAIGFIMGLGGAVVMAGGELILGQQLVQVDNVEEIGWILVSTTIAAALTHALLSYMFHLAEPAVWNRIENNQKISKVQEKAYENARAEIDRQAETMGSDLAASLVYQARAQLKAAALPHLRSGAQIETNTAESLSTGLVIPAGESHRQDATPKSFVLPGWPKRQPKTPGFDPSLMAELQELRAKVAAQPPQPTYTPVAIQDRAYAADTLTFGPVSVQSTQTKGDPRPNVDLASLVTK